MAEKNTTELRKPQGTVERVTVNLNGRAVNALERVAAITGETKTDAINRALLVYALLHETQENGGTIYTRERDAQELERLRVL
jgi:hypothetical protein